jgi:hypothetical protein
MRALYLAMVIASLAVNYPLFAADALMTAAQAQFKPIPTAAPAPKSDQPLTLDRLGGRLDPGDAT